MSTHKGELHVRAEDVCCVKRDGNMTDVHMMDGTVQSARFGLVYIWEDLPQDLSVTYEAREG